MTIPLSAPLSAHDAPASPDHVPHAGPSGSHEGGLDFALPPPVRVSRARALSIAAIVVSVLGAAFLLRWLPNRHAQQALAIDTADRGALIPRVQVLAPVVVSSDRSLTLPGSTQPLEETILYPRANGYIRRWLVDLGDRVQEGDLLAEIDTPDLDQQLAQARAQLAQAEAGIVQARANALYSKQSLERYKQLLPAGLASQADFDKAKAQAEVDQASIAVAEATTGSQRANLQYLGQLKTFARIVAPFAGTVTLRSVERGTLMTAGTATPLFKVSALDPVRVFVQVPQDVAASVRTGMGTSVTMREFPGRSFDGKVARSAGALDPTTRTMLTEIRVPNPKGEILTGMYAQVALTLPTPHRVLSIPATALMNDANGLRVAVVDPENHIRLARVVVERDLGATIELALGLQPDDRVVKLPSAELTDGRAVEVAP
jgi:membrane fusion protein, multidrug efflux system